MVKQIRVFLYSFCLLLAACATTDKPSESLYDEIGGQPTVEAITDNFINEISFNETIYRYFEKTNITRFREKFIEYLCVNIDGPCTYTGDTMLKSHQGQNINETDFNLTVELLVNAMEKSGLTYSQQNRVLKAFASMRSEMLYQ